MRLAWIPHAPWRVPQRAHLFAEPIARQHEVHVTNWETGFTTLQDVFSARYLHGLAPVSRQDGNITIHQIPRVAPALFLPPLLAFNDWAYRRHIDRIVRRHAIDVVVGTYVCGAPPGGVNTVLDVVDDNVAHWQAYGSGNRYAQHIEQHERTWARQAQTIVAASTVIRDRIVERGWASPDRVIVIPNGVDLDRYQPPADKAAVKHSLGLNPECAYVGNIGSLDRPHEASKLLAVAEAIQAVVGVRMLVVGAGTQIPALKREIARRNLDVIDLIGFQQGERLVRYFQALDVGLCPYATTPADHARSPLRLLHYSAVGAAVVCPRLHEVERMNFDNVTFAENSDQGFTSATLQALCRPGHVQSQIAEYDIRRLSSRYLEVLARPAHH